MLNTIKNRMKSKNAKPSRNVRFSSRPRSTVPYLERLEDRTLLSATLPDLGLDAGILAQDGDLVAFNVFESRQGNTDLNGDGDANDSVLHIYDAAAGTITNLGLAALTFNLVGDHLAFRVLESAQGGVDFNGDGDANDAVVHIYDASAGSIANLGLSTSTLANFPLDIDGNLMAFYVSESNQNNTDLNGDGDTVDLVLHVHNIDTGTTTNLGFEATFGGFQLEGSLLAFRVDETQQDLNGDGDLSDRVMHVHDVSTATTTNLGLASFFFHFELEGDLLGIVVGESEQGDTDLNGDGDLLDRVIHVYDAGSGTTTNLGLAASGTFNRTFELDGDLLAFRGSDGVLHVFDAGTGTTTNIGLNAGNIFRLNGDLLTFYVNEVAKSDLNGDGDTFDNVLHVYDAGTGTTTNVGLAVSQFQSEGDLVAFTVPEIAQGNTDLNGDGIVSLVTVVHVYDAASGTTTNVGLEAFIRSIHGDRLAFSVSELRQGRTDLNGDGDTSDDVLHVFDANTAEVTNFGLGVSNGFGSLEMNGDWLAFLVIESDQDDTDLNDDGDSSDFILHVVDLSIPLSNAPKIESADLNVETQSVTIQLNDTQLQAALATDVSNYRLLVANGDADGDGDPFNDGDETQAAISNVVYDSTNNRITLELLNSVFADAYRLEIDGDDAQADGSPGLANENGFFLLGGDFTIDFDLRPQTLLEQLLAEVESLGLSNGSESSLTAKLDAALHLLGVETSDDSSISAKLDAFIHGVNVRFDQGEISAEIRDDLITDAQFILDGLTLLS